MASNLDEIEKLSVEVFAHEIPRLYGNGVVGRWKNLKAFWNPWVFKSASNSFSTVQSLAVAYLLLGEDASCRSIKLQSLIQLIADSLLHEPNVRKNLYVRQRKIEDALKCSVKNPKASKMSEFLSFFRSWRDLLNKEWSEDLVNAFRNTRGLTQFPASCSCTEATSIRKYQSAVIHLVPSANSWTMTDWLDYLKLFHSLAGLYNYKYYRYRDEAEKLILIAERIVSSEAFSPKELYHLPRSSVQALYHSKQELISAFYFSLNESDSSGNNWFDNSELFKLVKEMYDHGDPDAKKPMFDYYMMRQ